MSRNLHRHSRLWMSLVGVVVIGALGSLFTLVPARHATASASEAPPPEGNAVDLVELGTLLHRVGLTPHSLAAAGVNSGSISAVVTAVADTMRSSPTALASADEAFDTAFAGVQNAERLLQAGLAGESGVSNLASARSTLGSAASARDAILTSIFNAGVTGLSQDQKTLLSTLAANGMKPASIEFRASNRSACQWAALRDALAQERYANASGDELGSDASTLLSTAREESATTDASANLNSRLSANTSAWNAAIAIQG